MGHGSKSPETMPELHINSSISSIKGEPGKEEETGWKQGWGIAFKQGKLTGFMLIGVYFEWLWVG